jgi:hypothetical protein
MAEREGATHRRIDDERKASDWTVILPATVVVEANSAAESPAAQQQPENQTVGD